MEDFELTRADLFAANFRDIINKANCPSWWYFFHAPSQLDSPGLKEVETISEQLWRTAADLYGQLYEYSPDLEDIPALLARIRQQDSRLEIPSDIRGYVFNSFPHGDNEAATRHEIACNVGRNIEEYSEQIECITSFLQDLSPAVEVAATHSRNRRQSAAGGWTDRNSVGGRAAGRDGAREPAAGETPERLYIQTTYSQEQLKRLYAGLVKGGFVEDGREQDFLLCFNPTAEKQGGFVWTLTGEKNREQIVIQAVCDLFDLLGIKMEDFGIYIQALCYNIPAFTKSAKNKAKRGWSRYRETLKTIIQTIQNQ